MMCAWNCKDIPNPCQSNKKGKDTLGYQNFVQNSSGFFDLEDLQHDSMTSRFLKQPWPTKIIWCWNFKTCFPFAIADCSWQQGLTHFHIVNQNFTLNNNRWQDSKFVLMKIMNSQPQKLPQNKASQPPTSGGHQTHRLAATMAASVDSRNSWTAAWSSAALRRRWTCSPWGRKSQRQLGGGRFWWEDFGGGEKFWGRGDVCVFFFGGGCCSLWAVQCSEESNIDLCLVYLGSREDS